MNDEEILELMPQQLREDLATVARLAAHHPAAAGPGLYRVTLNAGIVEHCRAVLARWGRPAIEPVPVSERLPEPHRKVIAYYQNDLGKARTILAEWVPAKSRTDDSLVYDVCEYDEEDDKYYWPEGWYELIENWDDYGAVFVNEGKITYWQPLPINPYHTLPVPQEGSDG